MSSARGHGSSGSGQKVGVSKYFPPTSPYTKLAARKKAAGTTEQEKSAPGRSTKGVLSSANRFPFSSTPEVSPRSNVCDRKQKSHRIQDCKENLKKVTVSVSSCSGISSPGKEEMARQSMALRSPVLAGASWEESAAAGRGQMTFVHNMTDTTGTMFGSQVFSSTLLQHTENQYEELGTAFDVKQMDPLKILHRNIEILKQLLLCRFSEMDLNGDSQKLKQMGSTPSSETSASYEFPYGCFTGVFPEAHSHAFHLLFQSYDLMEAEKRFRNVWPLDDKKTESNFRIAVAQWLTELIPENPKFFRNFKVDNLRGILVNSGTDRRFAQLIIALTNFVLYSTIKNNMKADGDKGDVKLLERPQAINDSRVASAQLYGIIAHLKRLGKLTGDFLKENLLLQIKAEKSIMEIHQQRKFKHDQYLYDLRQRSDPHLVRVVDEIHKKARERSGAVTEDDVSQCENLPILGPITPLLSKKLVAEIVRMHSSLSEIFQSQKGKFPVMAPTACQLESFLEKYQPVWSILSCTRNSSSVLPVTQLYMGKHHHEPPTLTKFVHCLGNSLRDFVGDDQLLLPVSKDLLQKFKHTEINMSCTKFRMEGIENQNVETSLTMLSPTLTKFVFGEDWSAVSGLNIPPLKSRLAFSSSRRMDRIPLSTGQTPKIVNFLNSNPFSNQRRQSVPGRILCSLPPVLSKTPQASALETSLQCSPPDPSFENGNLPMKKSSRLSFSRNEKRHSLQGLWQDEKGIMDTSCSGLLLDDESE